MRGRSLLLCLMIGALVFLSGSQAVFGAGFALYEGSARGNALGGTLVGRADDPSALFYNPAGITQLEGIQLMAGLTAIIPSTDVRFLGASFGSKDNVWLAPHFYGTYQFSDRLWFGLGMFSPFGLGTEFDHDWPGRFNNFNAVIQTLNINPNVALKLTDKLSLAAGFDVMWFDLKLEQSVANLTTMGLGVIDQDLTGSTFGYGFNLALHYRACDWMRLGVSYRSQIKQHIDGEAAFSPNLKFGPFNFVNMDVSGTVNLPDELFLGATFYPMPNLSFEAGAVWTRWSTFDELSIRYEKPIVLPNVQSATAQKDWNDVWRIQFGVEYKATDWLDLRAGYVFDMEPSVDRFADYLVPANDRHLFNFGPGFHWGNWSTDLSYTYLMIVDRDVDNSESKGFINPSEFRNGNAHLIGVSVGYKF
jgi:long-chain fatty acid transport protein